MKNYDEITNDLLERRDHYVAEQRKIKKRVMGTVSSLCCVCLVALLGFGMSRSGMFNATPPVTLDDSTIIGEKDYISPGEPDNHTNNGQIQQNRGDQTSIPSDNNSSGQNDPARILWTVNKVESSIGAAKLHFSSDKYYGEKKDITAVAEYLGKDLSLLEEVLPLGFEFVSRYETEFFYKKDGTPVYDTCAFCYKKEDQRITILVSKIGAPYDCMYEMDSPTISKLNDVEVVLGGIYKSDHSEEFELVFADFSHDGLQYRVTFENVPFDGTKAMYYIVTELTK